MFVFIQDPGGLGELSAHTAACRTRMAGLVSELLALIHQLPKPRLKELLVAYPDVTDNLTGLITSLKDTNNGALLVTGNTIALCLSQVKKMALGLSQVK